MVVVERAGKIFTLAKSGTAYEKQAWFSVDANVATHWDGAWAPQQPPSAAATAQGVLIIRDPRTGKIGKRISVP